LVVQLVRPLELAVVVACHVPAMIALMLLLPDHAFTRGRAADTDEQYYACDDHENCASLPLPASQADLKSPKYCVTHDMPMIEPVVRTDRG
jgi:hypothetical protein